jgi:hypothetical protein
MCAEAVRWRCHLSLIADALTARGIQVDDILSMTRSQVHSLIPLAQVQGHRITYPIGNRGSVSLSTVKMRDRSRGDRQRFRRISGAPSGLSFWLRAKDGRKAFVMVIIFWVSNAK